MRELAAELVRSKVDLILTDSTPATLAAKEATATIPIVFLVAADPVARGLVASLARPGGNLTGYVIGSYEAKMLETLKAALPRVSRVARPGGGFLFPDAERAATELGIELLGVEGLNPDRFDLFLANAHKAGADALLIPNIVGSMNRWPDWATRRPVPVCRRSARSRVLRAAAACLPMDPR